MCYTFVLVSKKYSTVFMKICKLTIAYSFILCNKET